MTIEEKATELSNKFVSKYIGLDGYSESMYQDILDALLAERKAALEEAAKIVDDCGNSNVENPAIDMFERMRRSGIRWCGEWAAKRIRALATDVSE